MSQVEVDKVIPQSGTTLTIGDSGDTINLVGTLQSNGSPLPGDISSVVAGTGLSGGGTTGAVTLNIESSQPTITSTGTLTGFTSTGIDDNADATAITITNQEKVGIGTVDPKTPLHITKSSLTGFVSRTASTLTLENSGGTEIYLASADSSYGQIRFGDDASTYSGGIQYEHNHDHMLFQVNSAERMRITSAGLVGIGTSSPAAPLHIDLNTGFANSSFTNLANNGTVIGQIRMGSSSDFGLDAESGEMFFQTGGSERMRIKGNGNVGIGESAPLGKLHVKTADVGASVHQNADELVLENNGNTGITIASSDTASGAIYFADSSNQFDSWIQYTHSSRALQFAAAGQERMRITSAGLVGIGTSSPSYKAHIQGTDGVSASIRAEATGTNSDAFIVTDNDANVFSMGIDGDNSDSWVLSNAFGLGSPKITVTTSGNVGIGTSSPTDLIHSKESNGSNISTQLLLNNQTGGSGSAGIGFQVSDDSETTAYAPKGAILFERTAGNGRGAFKFMSDNANDTNSFSSGDAVIRIEATGQLHTLRSGGSTFFDTAHKIVAELPSNDYSFLATQNMSATAGPHYFAKMFTNGQSLVGSITTSNTGTAFNTSSDYRLKENVNYDFDATTRLKQLKPARFNFIADADTTVDGFIAHEVSDIVPEAITGEKNAVNEDGSIQPQGIDQAKLVPVLTKALQEAITKIEELETRITELENA